MREIAFKAKEIGTGDWVYGYLVKIHEDDYRIVTEDDLNYAYTGGYEYDGSMTKIDKNTICQYTGLTDKNSNKIWENDVVKATVKQNSLCQSSSYSDFYQISYHEKHCYFYLKKKNNNLLFDGNWSYYLKSIEAIGNIFDNPELLKGGAE